MLRIGLTSFLLLVGQLMAFAGPEFSPDPNYDYTPPEPGSYTLPVIKRAGGGALVDSDGKSIALEQLIRGKITVLSFIYTRCAAGRACPYASNVLGQLQLASEQDKALLQNMRLVSLSFDPGNDTPQRMAEYGDAMRETKNGCEWRFLTAKSQANLEPILLAYGQSVDKRPNAADPEGPLFHIVRVFLIDSQGRIRNIYSSATLDPRLVLADVKTLLLEEAKISGGTRSFHPTIGQPIQDNGTRQARPSDL